MPWETSLAKIKSVTLKVPTIIKEEVEESTLP